MEVQPLNSWGDSFWKRHLKCLWWLKYIVFYSFDLIEDKLKIPELSIILGVTYILDVNTQILGLYSFGDYCYGYNDVIAI
ncbi:unnamed protein product [Blepharisma stoltei]|uniref:Uncharacterized protein n=1 Tax=Blepharisma stoltei TaxID=1481888 RepID=A0AAU9JSK4_9CILI|nr:unnamed protein product [Blepharisma stoltei]